MMSIEIIQVRDVPSGDAQVLRSRAAARNLSLSAYLRELIHADASRPSMEEVLDRIGTRDSVDVGGEEIRDLIEGDRD